MAGLLMITGGNLRLVNLLLVVITISAFVAASFEVQSRYGPWSSTVFLVILLVFYRPFVGALLSEHLGLALGCLGFALLLRGVDLRDRSVFLFGCFGTALALSARAGPFFVLPVLALWGARFFRRQSFLSWPVLAGGVGMMAIGVGSSVVLSWALGRMDGAFSNFSYVLYGLLTGGDWQSAVTDHPELRSLGGQEPAARIYALAFQILASDPWSLWRGAWRAWRAFLGTYSFAFAGRTGAFALLAAAAVGLVRAVRRAAPTDGLVMAAYLGVLVSVPFVPPWDAGPMRAFAASLPFIAILPALGVALTRCSECNSRPRRTWGAGAAVSAAAIVGVCFLAPIVGRARGDPQHSPTGADGCEATAFARLTPGSFVDVVEEQAIVDSRFAVPVDDFRAGLRKFGYRSLAEELVRLRPPFRLTSAPVIGPWGRSEFLLVTVAPLALAGGGARSSCVTLPTSPDVREYNLAYEQGGARAPGGARE